MQKDTFIQKLFEAARKAGLTEYEAYYTAGESFSTNVFQGEIVDYSVADSIGLCFRALVDGKLGYASTQVLDEDAIDLLIDGAVQNARLIDDEDEQFLYAGDAVYPVMPESDGTIAALTAADKIDMALKMEKTTLAKDARFVQVEGSTVETGRSVRQIINSKGLNVQSENVSMGAYVVPIARDGEKTSIGIGLQLSRTNDIDIETIAQEAAKEALLYLDAKAIPSGKYPVALRFDVASTLLSTFADVFSADNAQKGLSLLNGREGEKIASEQVTIIDDPLLAGGFASTPFDAEGVCSRTKTIVDKGVLKTLLHNLKTAHKQGIQTTGNAAKGSYSGPVGIAPTNFYIQPSSMTFDELMQKLGSGVLITSIEGMHAGVNQVSGEMSLSAKGIWVENGKLGRAINQITVAGNFYEILKNVEAVACDLKFGTMGGENIASPTLLIGELSIAGE